MVLNRINRNVYNRFIYANRVQKEMMHKVLGEQLENLQELFDMMDKDLDVMHLETHDHDNR